MLLFIKFFSIYFNFFMTEPFELTATKALELIDKNKLSYLDGLKVV